jgi:signal transduction histidine kinase
MMKQQLKNLANRHDKVLGEMQTRHASEFKNKEDEFSKELMELEWKQDVEIKDSIKADEDQLSEALQVQERELAMEGHIRGAESKALQERRVLNSLLNSVVDGVISIDPRGFIVKFKYALHSINLSIALQQRRSLDTLANRSLAKTSKNSCHSVMPSITTIVRHSF